MIWTKQKFYLHVIRQSLDRKISLTMLRNALVNFHMLCDEVREEKSETHANGRQKYLLLLWRMVSEAEQMIVILHTEALSEKDKVNIGKWEKEMYDALEAQEPFSGGDPNPPEVRSEPVFTELAECYQKNLAFVCSICSSFYVTENGIGNSMLVGFSQSSGKIICIVVTLIFPFVYGKFKKYIPLASAFSFALIYFLLYLAPSAGMLFLGMALLNVGMSLIPTYYQLRVSQNTPVCRMGLMMGLYTISIYGANLLCPYVPTVLQLLPGCDTYTATYLPIGIILGVLAVIYLIRLRTGREQQELDNYGQNI